MPNFREPHIKGQFRGGGKKHPLSGGIHVVPVEKFTIVIIILLSAV